MFKVITVYKDSAVLSVTEREIQCKLLREGNMRFAYYFSLIISLLNPAVWDHETWRTASLTMSSFYCIELSFILIYHSQLWLFFSLLLKIIYSSCHISVFRHQILFILWFFLLLIYSVNTRPSACLSILGEGSLILPLFCPSLPEVWGGVGIQITRLWPECDFPLRQMWFVILD